MASPSTMDDLSQPMSESFLHLSQDDTADLSTIQDDATNTFNTNDFSMFIRMAKSLDGQNQNRKQDQFDLQSNIQDEGHLPHKQTSDKENFNNNKPAFTTNTNIDKFRETYDDSKTASSATKLGFYPGKGTASGSFLPYDHFQNANTMNPKAYQDFQNNADNSRMFSSHSTPFLSKSMPFNGTTKHSNKKGSFLPEINETRNEDTMIDKKNLGPTYPKSFQNLANETSDDEVNDESTLDQHHVLAHSLQTHLNSENDVAWHGNLTSPQSDSASEPYANDDNKENIDVPNRTPLKPRASPSHTQQVQFSAEDLYKSIQPYLVANMKEFKDVIEDMCIQNLKQQQKQQQQQPQQDLPTEIGKGTTRDIYKTPVKRPESNEDKGDGYASSGDDDNLSLHGTEGQNREHNESHRQTSSHAGGTRKLMSGGDEEISSIENSPITTPPQSREYSNEDDKYSATDRHTDRNTWYQSDQNITNDGSYIPRRARQKNSSGLGKGTGTVRIQNVRDARSQQHYFNKESKSRTGSRSNSSNYEDDNINYQVDNHDKLRHLQLQINALKQTTEQLNQDKYLLQNKVNTLTDQLDDYDKKNSQINLEDDMTTDRISLSFIDPKLKKTIKKNMRPSVKLQEPTINEQLQRQIEELQRKNRSLNAELTTIQKDNDELNNENKYLQHQLDSAHDSMKEYEFENLKLSLEVEKLLLENSSVGKDTKKVMTGDAVGEKFKEQYNKLQLYKVDQLGKNELNTMIKNIMLSLLVANYDELPKATVKVGRYLHLTLQFIDDLHKFLYTNNSEPSRYLRDHQFSEELPELEMCLLGMMKKIIKK